MEGWSEPSAVWGSRLWGRFERTQGFLASAAAVYDRRAVAFSLFVRSSSFVTTAATLSSYPDSRRASSSRRIPEGPRSHQPYSSKVPFEPRFFAVDLARCETEFDGRTERTESSLDELPLEPAKDDSPKCGVEEEFVALGVFRVTPMERCAFNPVGIQVGLTLQNEQFVGCTTVGNNVELPARG